MSGLGDGAERIATVDVPSVPRKTAYLRRSSKMFRREKMVTRRLIQQTTSGLVPVQFFSIALLHVTSQPNIPYLIL
eukprot:14747071-Ditylum_brightwellii.AAC.1